MNIMDAWGVLGEDWISIVQNLSNLPDISSRVHATECMFMDAKKSAKRLMAVHHPDKNPRDSKAAERFKRIQEALQTIEHNTKLFRDKYEEMKKRSEQRAASDGFILIK